MLENIEMLASVTALIGPARRRLLQAQGRILRDCQPIGFGDHCLPFLRWNGFRLALKRIPVGHLDEQYFMVSKKL